MAEEAQRSRLGRGLAALIGDVGTEAAPSRGESAPRRAALEHLRPNPRNPRRNFPDAELDELAASIQSKGLIQPVVVRRVAGKPAPYEIVAGERRWRAAQRAGLSEIPIVLVEIDDRTSLEFAIIENVQREDLNAIEEATGYQNLIDEYSYTQAELAQFFRKKPKSHNEYFTVIETSRRRKGKPRRRPPIGRPRPGPPQCRRSLGGRTAGHRARLERPRDGGDRPKRGEVTPPPGGEGD